MSDSNLIKKQKSWGVFFLALLINLLLAGAYAFMLIKFQGMKHHISELNGNIVSLTNQKENLQSIKQNLRDTADLRKQADNYFIAQDGTIGFLNTINSLAAENNLISKVVSIEIQPYTEEPDTFESIHLTVEVSGTWSNAYQFASLLELMPLKISVNRATLERFSDNSSTPWKGTLAIVVLKLK